MEPDSNQELDGLKQVIDCATKDIGRSEGSAVPVGGPSTKPHYTTGEQAQKSGQ